MHRDAAFQPTMISARLVIRIGVPAALLGVGSAAALFVTDFEIFRYLAIVSGIVGVAAVFTGVIAAHVGKIKNDLM